MHIFAILVISTTTIIYCHTINSTNFPKYDDFLIEWKPLEITGNFHRNRMEVYHENLKKIHTHNRLYERGEISYKLGVTSFTHWTSEEFSRYVNKFHFDPSKIKNSTTKYEPRKSSKVPKTVDWRLSRAVTEVKNQGHCGSCWSFSATGALEGQAKLTLNKTISLSEQNLIDCATEDFGNFGCDGGNYVRAFSYVEKYGIEKEEYYPYVAQQEKCRQKSAELYVTEEQYIDENEEALKNAVAKIGPISVAIEATEELQNYSGGVFFDRTCTKFEKLNHAVLVVGYGEENGKEYWLIKNSWGSWWGEQGYLKLARNHYDNCGISQLAIFPRVK